MTDGPFAIGDRVVVLHADGVVIDAGIIDGDRGEDEGVFRYDVAGELGRHDNVPEHDLDVDESPTPSEERP